MASTHRFFRVEPDSYLGLTSYVDSSRGYPTETTDRGLPLFEWLLHEEETGWGIVPIDKWRFNEEDETVVAKAIADGVIEEITEEAYDTIRKGILDPEPEPEPEPDPPEPPPLPPLPEPPPPPPPYGPPLP